jgi:hypothetical protein
MADAEGMDTGRITVMLITAAKARDSRRLRRFFMVVFLSFDRGRESLLL